MVDEQWVGAAGHPWTYDGKFVPEVAAQFLEGMLPSATLQCL